MLTYVDLYEEGKCPIIFCVGNEGHEGDHADIEGTTWNEKDEITFTTFDPIRD